MEKNFTQRGKVETAVKTTNGELMSFVEQAHANSLASESYEDVASALTGAEALQEFRRKTSEIPFSSFHELMEGMTIIDKSPIIRDEKDKQKKTLVEIMTERTHRFSPRVADLYQALLCEISDEPYKPYFQITDDKITKLKRVGDLAVLFSSEISWDMKLNRIETRLVGYLSGVRALDKREGNEMTDDVRKWREEQLKHAPVHPPQRRNESRPGVDPMERLKEGERAPAIWTIFPAWGGYYKEQVFHKWDSVRNTWYEDKYTYSEVKAIPLSGNKNPKKGPIDITLSAKASTGQWISVPVPYTHDFHKIEAGGRHCQTMEDQNGDLVIFVKGSSEMIDIEFLLAPNPDKKFRPHDESKITVQKMPSEFSEETIVALEKINSEQRGNIARAQAIKRYVLQRINYLAPKDRVEAEYYNNIYRTSPKGFAGAVDEVKKADCDVGNTYGSALCARLGIPTRHCIGQSVKGKNQEGVAEIHSGTGHAWTEVFDEINKEWVRMDFTSAGDPNLEEDQQGKSGEAVPGDYGSQEAVRPSDEQLERLRQKLAERKEQLSYSKEERQLAQAAGVDLKEARQIVKEINEAGRTTLSNGELVVRVLSKIFNLLVESRKALALSYSGPVRESEGGEEIIDIVSHYIQSKAGEVDPSSRELPTEETKEEKLIGGFDVYIIGDKSGSMQSTNEKGERLWQMQRRAEYLIFSCLYQFEKDLERAGIQEKYALSIKTQGISFRGSGPDDIDIDKPLSNRFTDKDKVTMWQSLTTQGSGNGDVASLTYIYNQIQGEILSLGERGKKDDKLRIVISCSDGAPDDPERVHDLAEQVGRLGAVVVGIGLTDAAVAVPTIYNTEYSRGDIARNIDDLPAIVAKHIIWETIKLFPKKTKADAKKIIEKYCPF